MTNDPTLDFHSRKEDSAVGLLIVSIATNLDEAF
jgi:hypothetical protein